VIDLQNLIPLLKDLQEKHEAQRQAFCALNKLLNKDGFALYWDDSYLGDNSEGRYCIYPLPKTLEAESKKEVQP
jgi:hypothetical protein